MVLVHAAPSTLAPYRSKHLGVLCSPRCVYGNDIEEWTWAADNDAYSDWNPDRYRKMLDRVWGRKGCLFVTAPDVVGDAERTLELFEEWYDDLSAVLQPIALVAQDGLVPDMVPWQRIDALFLGGSDLFKMGEDARSLVEQARARGKWVHMGRVNTQQRMRYAKAIRCDSIDGTSLSWFRDTYLPSTLAHAAQPRQMIFASQEGRQDP
jgi:hypothetical protein